MRISWGYCDRYWQTLNFIADGLNSSVITYGKKLATLKKTCSILDLDRKNQNRIWTYWFSQLQRNTSKEQMLGLWFTCINPRIYHIAITASSPNSLPRSLLSEWQKWRNNRSPPLALPSCSMTISRRNGFPRDLHRDSPKSTSIIIRSTTLFGKDMGVKREREEIIEYHSLDMGRLTKVQIIRIGHFRSLFRRF